MHFLAQRGSNLPNGLALRAKTLRLFCLLPYIAFLVALPAGRRTVSGLVGARNKGKLTTGAQQSSAAEGDILGQHLRKTGQQRRRMPTLLWRSLRVPFQNRA